MFSSKDSYFVMGALYVYTVSHLLSTIGHNLCHAQPKALWRKQYILLCTLL